MIIIQEKPVLGFHSDLGFRALVKFQTTSKIKELIMTARGTCGGTKGLRNGNDIYIERGKEARHFA